ncbi:c-type cytochrome biogenesis protein CcmI [Methylocella sp.]|uniref:c-type cytochrome biogenesis protein CcmI n=1 Tax=Methylocella sp. TaxID=1978226 RepID=UPI0035AF0B81
MLWVVLALLSAVALLAICWPLIRPPRALSRGQIDVAFYKAQLAEVDRDAERGLLAPKEADGARTEAARRLIAAAEAPEEIAPGRSRAVMAILATAALAPALALGLYAAIGRPGMPDLPLAARMSRPANEIDVMAAISKIEAHLAGNPDDAKGYALLAPIYMRLGRYEDAAKSFAALRRLKGDSAELDSLEGEALVAAADGDVSDQARKLFEAAVAADPKSFRARFYLGLAAAAAGEKDEARRIWGALLADAPADAPFAPAVRARLAALDGQAIGAAQAAPGPAASPERAAQIAGMEGPQQQAAIRAMVDRLAARLAESGGGVDDWTRLVRAYVVLQDQAKARSALADARKNLAGDSKAGARIDALARELGLEG